MKFTLTHFMIKIIKVYYYACNISIIELKCTLIYYSFESNKVCNIRVYNM